MIQVNVTYSTGDTKIYQLSNMQTDQEIVEQIQGELSAGFVGIDVDATFTWTKENI